MNTLPAGVEVPRVTREQWEAAAHLTDQVAPRFLPPGWRLVRCVRGKPYIYHRTLGAPIEVLVSADVWDDGKTWLHVSAVARGRTPSYEEMCEVKQVFVGEERQAVHVFPPRSKHVNIHPYCLHLWACLDDAGDGLPDFGKEGTI